MTQDKLSPKYSGRFTLTLAILLLSKTPFYSGLIALSMGLAYAFIHPAS